MKKTTCLLTVWFAAAVLAGAILTSFHQPFRSPDSGILQIAGEPPHEGWRVIHVLSGSCGCSQRIMQHLLARPLLDGAAEQVVLVDGEEPYLSGSTVLIAHLAARGFTITHRRSREIPEQFGLRGVPLLILAPPGGKVAYVGGYGSHEDQDVRLFDQLRAGRQVVALPIVGCAIGARLRRSADPFRLKY